jgi:hypothetical protein
VSPAAHEPSWEGVWIVIPAYDEAATIRALAQAARARCPRVIVVDDGSSDGTAACLRGLPITVLRHPVNRGKAASLRTAFAHALARGADAVVTLDGDGQHDPGDAGRLVAAWRAAPDRIVIGARLHDRSRFPPLRYFGNRFACFWISWAAGHRIADSQSGFRVYPKAVLEMALGGRVQTGRFTMESEILIEAARRGHLTLAAAIPGTYPEGARRSHYRGAVDTIRIVAMVASQLLRRGMHPRGLWRSVAKRAAGARPTEPLHERALEPSGAAE